jgi:hypothetical protein
MDKKDSTESDLPGSGRKGQIARGAIQAIGGFIPFASGFFSAAAGAWSEEEQKRVNDFLHGLVQMVQDEVREKHQTMLEIAARLDMHDETIKERIQSEEYQKLLKKAFRNWAGAESEKKREYVRNILSNAAATRVTTDEVVSLFLDWLHLYSEFHFSVIGDIYQNPGATRQDIWRRVGEAERPRENSAEADLFKLLIDNLSIGHVIRQHRETDYHGNFIRKSSRKAKRGSGPQPYTSAFDDEKQYELTNLGQQFVHYAMTDLPLKIEFDPGTMDDEASPSQNDDFASDPS